MRIPLAANLESRDGTLDQDAIVKNGIIEVRGEDKPPRLRKRPGVTTNGTATSKLALLYEKSRTYSTDLLTEVALGDPSYGTVYGISVEKDYDSTRYYTWNGSAWAYGSAHLISANLDSVFGAAQLDGYFFLMKTNGKIYNSGLGDPTAWAALDYISLSATGGTPAALCRHDDFIVGFAADSMQLFYDAGNPTGSVLARVNGGTFKIGCVVGRSIASVNRATLWLGREQQRGRGVYMIRGMVPTRISTPSVDRILAADDMASVYGTCVSAGGVDLYLIALSTTGVTLVYNINSGDWSVWTYTTSGSAKAVSSITRSGTTATVNTSVAHTLSDGDAVTIASADQAEYNGIFQAQYVDSDTFTIEVTGSPATPATGTITATPFSETIFPFMRYVGEEAAGAMLSTTGTTWYKFSDATYRDLTSQYINFFARTLRLDGGSQKRKKMARIGVVGTDVSDTAMIRWSDDDSGTFSAYRRVTLSDDTPELRRCGAFERRSIEFRHIGNTAPIIDALELDIGG